MIKLSGYKIIKKIGSGGMGDVYLAEHEKLEKMVAIKSLHKILANDTSFRERFSQEAKTHSKLDHPNIVKLLDYKETKGGLFLIMEYMDGKELDEHIKKVTGPIPEKVLTNLFTQILDAISYAHDEGLVHRDIKPSNIMIDKKGRIKVFDFGIAKLQEEEKGLTKTGIQVGTVAYMSPEQVHAKKVDKLSDIYSLGVTLFYMAVGKSPYEGDTNTFSIQTKVVSDTLPLASNIYPGVSNKLDAIILKATQKDKKDRYQSCEEFRNDLKSKNLVVPKVSETSTQKHLVKKEKKFKLSPIISVVLLFVIAGFIGFYKNYQTKLETQREEIQDLRLTEEKRLAKEKVNKKVKATTAEEAKKKVKVAEQERLAKEKADQERLAKEKADQERLAKEKAEQEKKSLMDFLNLSDLYFDNISLTLNSTGRYFVTNLLQKSQGMEMKFSPSEILIVDRKYIVFISKYSYENYYCDIYNTLYGYFTFQSQKLDNKTGILSCSYSKSNNVLCSDQGVGFFYRKNYFKLSQFKYSSSFKNFTSYFPSYDNDLLDVPIYKWK
jgi:serine/threonine protein kinase